MEENLISAYLIDQFLIHCFFHHIIITNKKKYLILNIQHTMQLEFSNITDNNKS